MGGARGVSAKVRLRHDTLDEVTRIVADGATEAGKVIVEIASANAPTRRTSRTRRARACRARAAS
jgi:ribosomal protein RSM22 (predicted rRNA methylase)